MLLLTSGEIQENVNSGTSQQWNLWGERAGYLSELSDFLKNMGIHCFHNIKKNYCKVKVQKQVTTLLKRETETY